jgi:Resolvase, N terminal domain
VAIYRDEGISGTKGRDKRPGLDALLKGVARREFDIVAAWSVCRLGRSLSDQIALLGEQTAVCPRSLIETLTVRLDVAMPDRFARIGRALSKATKPPRWWRRQAGRR